jgi:RNA polymerase sigma-70 factor (ECF subfamily)
MSAPGDPRPHPERTFDLLRQVRAGDARALDRLMERNLLALRRWATGRLPPRARDLHDTMDLVQETILAALPKLEQFDHRGEGALLAYLRQALLNRIRNEYRRVGRRPEMTEVQTALDAKLRSPLESAILSQDLERYDAAMEQLSEDERAAVMLRLELGYGYAEIAQSLEKASEDAARMAVSRAVLKLAKLMKAD